MSGLHDVATPGILISNTWPTSRERQGETLAAIESVLEGGFFEAFQTVEVPYARERKAIASLLGAEKMPLTYCLTRVLNENGANLSDLDQTKRKKSYELAISRLDEAREAGATSVSLISGPTPSDPTRRVEAVKLLGDSLLHVCRQAQAEPALQVIVEPLDIKAHKRCALGLTSEALELCKSAVQEGLDLRLCIDTAHMILNGEEPMDSLALAQQFVVEFHFCNCVLDTSHPLYGDHHLPFGPPGVVDFARMGQYMTGSVELGFYGADKRPGVFCEVLKREPHDSLWVMQHCQEALETAWDMHLMASLGE
jgi:sugar phosphate isomerase/epimerase